MDFVVLGGDTHHFRAAPGDRPHIAIDDVVGLDHPAAGGVDLVHRIGNLEVEDPGRVDQPLAMRRQLEDLAVVDPLALEDGAGVVQAMGEDMHLGLRPDQQFAVEPDFTVQFVVGHISHDIVPFFVRMCPHRRELGNIRSEISQHY